MAAMRGFAVAALALVGLLFAWTPLAERMDLALLDAEYRFLRKVAPKPAPDDIIVVGVDDATFKAIAEPLGMWHEPLGKALEKIASAHPRAIGLDITLPDRSYEGMRPGLDKALMTGLVRARENGPLVAALAIDSRTQSARTIHLPFLVLLREERLGITLFGRDSDGLTRRFSLAFPTDDGAFPTLVGRLCRALQPKRCRDGLIDFALGEPLRYVPLHEVLKSEDAGYLDKLFRDRIVLVGETQQFSDRIAVPVNLAGWETFRHNSPGVVVHAAALRTAMHGDPAEGAGKPVLLLLVAAAATLVLMRNWRLAFVTGLVGGALFLAAVTFALHRGYSVDSAAVLFTLALAWMLRTAYEAWHERRERERLRGAFSGYVSPPVMRAILKGDIRPAREGERLELAFVFADLRGSTALTAQSTPESAMALLNRFHQVIASAIHRQDGMLDNIRGDGVMAVFGAPKPIAEPTKAAWAAVQEMFRNLDRLNAELAREGKPALSMVAGLAFGEAVVGHVGSKSRYNYTAIGDAVNLAARLQEEAKKRGVRALLSGPARERVPEADLEPLGPLGIHSHPTAEGWGWR
jgi:adenylate cyclase